MKVLVVRMYEGRELHYTKDGKVQNKNQTVKLIEFDFVNKFLKYCYTLSKLILLEEVYEAKYVSGEQSKCTAVSAAEFKKFETMLIDAGVKKITEDPLVEENKALQAKSEFSEKELAKLRLEMDELREMITLQSKPAKAEDAPSAQDDFKQISLKKTSRDELIRLASEKGFQLTGDETKTQLFELIK